MNSTLFFLMMSLIISESSFAAIKNIEKKLFTMEKDYHAENKLIISSQVDEACKFVTKDNDYLDLYWLMGGKSRKEISSTIKSGIQKRVKFEGMSQGHDSFKIRLNDLNELKHDLEDTSIDVKSEINNGNCQIKSILRLGVSAHYRKINLKRFYCEVTTNMVGIPNGCKFIDLQGIDIDTSENVNVRFNSK